MGSTPEKKLLLIDTDPGIGDAFACPNPPMHAQTALDAASFCHHGVRYVRGIACLAIASGGDACWDAQHQLACREVSPLHSCQRIAAISEATVAQVIGLHHQKPLQFSQSPLLVLVLPTQAKASQRRSCLADDAMAILAAFNSPEVEVIGLTSLFGNVRTPMATANAVFLRELAGRHDVRPLSLPCGPTAPTPAQALTCPRRKDHAAWPPTPCMFAHVICTADSNQRPGCLLRSPVRSAFGLHLGVHRADAHGAHCSWPETRGLLNFRWQQLRSSNLHDGRAGAGGGGQQIAD